ncbi:hypothetical protein E2C01_078565 [Portunus trituberculatus]|uniref:Uncharacterized protein n=1 Tax=Portunus trituberculatus TaxID=210409 RepID=A0A5B7IN65_PORTR|nr:hypothetical protein [Portunus trituberculatus]
MREAISASTTVVRFSEITSCCPARSAVSLTASRNAFTLVNLKQQTAQQNTATPSQEHNTLATTHTPPSPLFITRTNDINNNTE